MSSRYKIVNANKCQVGLDGKLHDPDEGGGSGNGIETISFLVSQQPLESGAIGPEPVITIENKNADIIMKCDPSIMVESRGSFQTITPDIYGVSFPIKPYLDKYFDFMTSSWLISLMNMPEFADYVYQRVNDTNYTARKMATGIMEVAAKIDLGSVAFTRDGTEDSATYLLTLPIASLTELKNFHVDIQSEDVIAHTITTAGNFTSTIGLKFAKIAKGGTVTPSNIILHYTYVGTWK